MPSSFTLELPPYRTPQFAKVLVRAFLDRTLFVLGRAVIVAIPAGLIIWLMANVTAGDASLLSHCTEFLDPFGRMMGLDGVILLAFILGFPANEIVVPIIIMAYCTYRNIGAVRTEGFVYIERLDFCNSDMYGDICTVPLPLLDILHYGI